MLQILPDSSQVSVEYLYGPIDFYEEQEAQQKRTNAARNEKALTIAKVALDLIANTGMDAHLCSETAKGCLRQIEIALTRG